MKPTHLAAALALATLPAIGQPTASTHTFSIQSDQPTPKFPAIQKIFATNASCSSPGSAMDPSSRPKAAHFAAAVERPPHLVLTTTNAPTRASDHQSFLSAGLATPILNDPTPETSPASKPE
jgi:hypothetical protein